MKRLRAWWDYSPSYWFRADWTIGRRQISGRVYKTFAFGTWRPLFVVVRGHILIGRRVLDSPLIRERVQS